MNTGLDDAVLNEIAAQSEVNVAQVRRHYNRLLTDLHSHARIHDFIPLLAMKQVRQHFRPIHPIPVEAQPSDRQRIINSARQMEYTLISYGH